MVPVGWNGLSFFLLGCDCMNLTQSVVREKKNTLKYRMVSKKPITLQTQTEICETLESQCPFE